MQRINSIDFTRGLVMIIMALDHVRDLMHSTSLTQDPTNLTTTTVSLFFTRWITHLCAPTFVFLSGTSAYLSLQHSASVQSNQRFLLTRGLWLIILEFTLINFALWFDVSFRILALQVIGAIGFGLIILSLLLRLSNRIILAVGLVIIVFHNLLQDVSFATNSPLHIAWSLLFRPGVFPLSQQFIFAVLYPLIPWLGIMLTGFGMGSLFMRPIQQRRNTLCWLGGATLGVFILLRFINLYGDPAPWTPQKNSLFTLLSFINTTKYPPSLLYTSMTLGIALLLLALVDGVSNSVTRLVTVYGRVPLFYYLIHWYLIHSLMVGLMLLQGFQWSDLSFAPFGLGRPLNATSGIELVGVYLVWASVVVLLYPLCRWYWNVKKANKTIWWLRYI